MKKIIWSLLCIIGLSLFLGGSVSAQGMMGNWTSSPSGVASENHTAREEQEGKEIWKKLQAKQVECKNLTNDNFERLGEYFMGQMAGDSHETMNNMMVRMIGEKGEEQMHVAMGKRMTGCDPDAPMPQSMMNGGMMNMMMGGGGNPMMGYSGWNGFGFLGWLPMVLFWILLILGIVAILRYLGGSTKNNGKEKSPLEILKERYAKGEIDKKEFEEKKKDLA